MLHDLVKHWRGKSEVVMTDTLPRVRNRQATLRKSQTRGIKSQVVTYSIRKSVETGKFKMPPADVRRWQ